MRADGAVRQQQPLADLAVGEALGSQPGDLELLSGQAVDGAGGRATARLTRRPQLPSGTVTPIAEVTVPRIIEHLEAVIDGLDAPPVLIGHSAGGAFVQILLDHGRCAAGVALNSAPTEGVKVVPLSQAKSVFPVLNNPKNRHRAVGLTFEQWTYAFTNTFEEAEARRLYERYAIPAPGSILWGSVLANFSPGHQDTWVDYHNDDRAPLLFISGGEDHIMPPKVQRSNAKHYKSKTVTEVEERPGRSHLMPAEEGWQEVADHALDWALQHAVRR